MVSGPTDSAHFSKHQNTTIRIAYPRPMSELLLRSIDTALAITAVGVLLPIFMVIALLIKIDSRGPVLFRQKRIGRNGKPFLMLKFRSMIPNAETLRDEFLHLNVMSGPFFKIPQDPRVTRLGRFLRKSSLDELPQFFNVLFGEMAIVGPRPMLPSEFDTLKCYDIVRIKPGITGLWQVSGRNEVTDCYEKLRLDREYLRNRSILLNIKIILKTFSAVISSKGAS